LSLATKYLGISERTSKIIYYILEAGFIIFMISVFAFMNNVNQNYHQICVNPNKYCPYNYIVTDLDKYELGGSLIQVNVTQPNATLIEERLQQCALRCDKCQDMISIYQKQNKLG